jgi:hypothetical protein
MPLFEQKKAGAEHAFDQIHYGKGGDRSVFRHKKHKGKKKR